MSNKINIALIGATGLVGEATVSFLNARDFPVGDFSPLASANTAGQKVELGGKYHTVKNVADFDFSQVNVAIFAANDAVSAEYVSQASTAGCIVIDTSSCFADDDNAPMVIPEVNPEALAGYPDKNKQGGIIVSPDSATIQMLVALKPLHDAVGIERINVVTYQAVTALGKAGMSELASQTIALLNMQEVKREAFPQQIAFNVLPQVDTVEENGYLSCEMKMVRATKKVLMDDDIVIHPTTLQAPVFFGHSQVLSIETRGELGAAEAQALLRKAPGVEMLDGEKMNSQPTAVTEAAGNDSVFVGRIRDDISDSYGLSLWVVADNVRKGAALNCVQILELLVKEGL
ncbi:MAG: aspartate-semialdehyde dehydrogenase [Ectothiorhodospiraceae bacterium]|nr:aspartate-semialdehyde dehydrogenase [Ectothiorhodospiraceae bacterium]